jgi:predicted nucleic-acid-binding protein
VQTLDTNVLVRVLIGVDPEQTSLAEQAFLAAIANGEVILPDVVLAEVAWVLRGYGLNRDTRHDLLNRLVRTKCVTVIELDGVMAALDRFEQGGDFADHLLLSRAQSAHALPVMTFDQRFAQTKGVQFP